MHGLDSYLRNLEFVPSTACWHCLRPIPNAAPLIRGTQFSKVRPWSDGCFRWQICAKINIDQMCALITIKDFCSPNQQTITQVLL